MLLANTVVALPVLVPLQCVKSLCQFRKNTGLEPVKTSLSQALGKITNIFRGTLETLNDVQLIKTGDTEGGGAATLLNVLTIFSFSFRMIIQQVFHKGSLDNPEMHDITEQTLHLGFLEAV